MLARMLFAYLGAIVGPILLLLLGAVAARVLLLLPSFLPTIEGHPPFEIVVLSGALIGVVVSVSYSDVKQQYLRGAIFARSVAALTTFVLFVIGLYRMIVQVCVTHEIYHVQIKTWLLLFWCDSALWMPVFAPLLSAVVSGFILRKHKRLPEK